VFTAVANKAQLLKAARDVAMVGDDILSSYMASDVYLRLVHRLGWIAEDFQRWLEATLAWQLLGTG
jgi:hypothetical protein